jgi:signal transduction histidine kinase
VTPARSLERTLPIGISAIVVLAVAATAIGSYRDVQHSAKATVAERLNRLSTQLATLLNQGLKPAFTSLGNVAALPDVRAFALRPITPPDTLRRLAAAPQVQNIEIWDREGRRVVAVGRQPPPLEPLMVHGTIERIGSREGALGPITIHDSGASYPIVVPIPNNQGYLVLRRNLSSSRDGGRQLAKLLGLEEAGLLIGNATRDVWTDFSATAPAPPAEVAPGAVSAYERGGAKVFGRLTPVEGTPWMLAVELPQGEVIGRTRAFLIRLGTTSLLVVVLTAIAAWMFSRRITRPLRSVTEAAEAIAAGRPSVPVHVTAIDEVARLTVAFNTMAGEVEAARARLEAQVENRTAALRETLQELEAFSYTVSHDLRAPLRAMQGFAQALLEDYAPSLDATARDYATRVVDASRRMDELIQDLLAYSRLSREQLSLSRVDLDTVAAEAVREIEQDVKRRGGRIDVASPLGPVIGNGRILQQILSNLLGNAVKFIAPDVAPEIRVHSELRNGRRRLWVEDNGIGIAPEHRERIFRVFERLHGGESYPGTGIGLAIVRRGAERMDGQAGVESTPGRGSRFWIELPSEGAS